jgi:predicted neuraminidase
MDSRYIEMMALANDGRLYHNCALDTVESLIPNPFTSCHAADLLELPNEDILCCWFAGSDEGNADISIVMSRLKRGASEWLPPVKISDDPARSEQNPSLFLAPGEELWVVYTAQAARTQDMRQGFNLQYTAEIRRKRSRDGGSTWGPTEVMFARPGSFCRQKIQVLSSGRWIFGNWICFPDETRNGSDLPVMQVSDDRGCTWREVDIPSSRGRVHANVVELGPGRLVAFLRSRFADRIYLVNSRDDGNSWSAPVRTELRNNNAGISAIRLKSGGIAIAYNDVSFNDDMARTVWPNQRCPVTVALSEDEGATWPWRRVVEHGEGFTGPWNDVNNRRYEYPVIMQGADDRLHIAYSWGNRKNIKYMRVDEGWIRGRATCYGAENDGSMPCRR